MSIAKDLWGFTPDPTCDNCGGTGVFSVDEQDDPEEPCTFCLGDAIKRGELDGVVDGEEYVGGRGVST
jgi:hypothetical protein